jgi:peroxiredoxin
MALTYTPAVELGSSMPSFALSTVEGKSWSSKTIESAPARVVIFMCNHCPYVKAIEKRLIKLAKDLAAVNVPVVGICSNDPTEHPEDAPKELLKTWREKNYGFTYLVDESQAVARAFGAVCTPDFFVYDKEGRLAYRGRLDDSWRDEHKVSREELKMAVKDIIERGQTDAHRQTPSMGCSIKWKTT